LEIINNEGLNILTEKIEKIEKSIAPSVSSKPKPSSETKKPGTKNNAKKIPGAKKKKVYKCRTRKKKIKP